MGYTPEDAEREAGEEYLVAQILEDHRDVIVSEFVEERLASYYNDHPELSRTAESALSEARRLLDVSSSAALIFAFSSIEIAIQDVLLKPVVAGLIHNANLSDLLAELIDVRNRQTEKILFTIMDEIGAPSLKDQVLSGDRAIWKEKQELQSLRNRVVHRGVPASREEAERALALGEYFLNNLYPQVRDYFTCQSTGWA